MLANVCSKDPKFRNKKQLADPPVGGFGGEFVPYAHCIKVYSYLCRKNLYLETLESHCLSK